MDPYTMIFAYKIVGMLIGFTIVLVGVWLTIFMLKRRLENDDDTELTIGKVVSLKGGGPGLAVSCLGTAVLIVSMTTKSEYGDLSMAKADDDGERLVMAKEGMEDELYEELEAFGDDDSAVEPIELIPMLPLPEFSGEETEGAQP